MREGEEPFSTSPHHARALLIPLFFIPAFFFSFLLLFLHDSPSALTLTCTAHATYREKKNYFVRSHNVSSVWNKAHTSTGVSAIRPTIRSIDTI